MATHLPVNHWLRPLYRALSGAIGLYLTGFGITSVIRGSGKPFFDQGDTMAWGLHTNTAFGVLSIVVGLIIFIGAVVGRNVDRFIDLVGAGVFIVFGLIMLALCRTTFNFLNYDVTAAIISFIIGAILLLAGLYGRVGPAGQRDDEEGFRHYQGGDPVAHTWTKLPPKRPKPAGSKFA